MKNILDYRVVILDKDANIIEFPLVSSGMHQDCLDDFAKKNGYEYSSESYLAKNGNVIFKNAGNKIVTIDMPECLSEEQLYFMDYLQNWLQEVEWLEACKYTQKGKEFYSILDHVYDRFSTEIIQSYYSSNNERVAKR